MSKLVAGVGINDADYKVTYHVDGKQVMCPYYRRWKNMLSRCYNVNNQKKNHTYKSCSVCEEWVYFSNFKSWMENQDWEGKVLDKDLRLIDNKIYSPESCLFIDQRINKFLTDSGKSRGDYPIGVTWNSTGNCYMAQCRDPFTDKQVRKNFNCIEDSHLWWLEKKIQFSDELSNIEKCKITSDSLRKYYRCKYSDQYNKLIATAVTNNT